MAEHSDSMTLSASSLVGHTLLNDYIVDKRIGNGGMAWIYHANNLQQDNPWAIKILFEHLCSDENTVRRFFQEAQIQHQLQHPNIVHVVDFIKDKGICGFVLEWCDAGDLHQLLNAQKLLTPTQLTQLVPGLLDAMIYAHASGIIHRDLKPSNVLLQQHNNRLIPKISDFGIAKILDKTSHTRTGSSMGTYAYMAPEQAHNSKQVDERADIYSLGVLLYQMSTGRLPYPEEGNLNDVIRKMQQGPPSAPLEAPEPLQAIILQCLAHEPEDRYPDVRTLKAHFLQAMNIPPHHAQKLSPPNIPQQALDQALGFIDDDEDRTVLTSTPPNSNLHQLLEALPTTTSYTELPQLFDDTININPTPPLPWMRTLIISLLLGSIGGFALWRATRPSTPTPHRLPLAKTTPKTPTRRDVSPHNNPSDPPLHKQFTQLNKALRQQQWKPALHQFMKLYRDIRTPQQKLTLGTHITKIFPALANQFFENLLPLAQKDPRLTQQLQQLKSSLLPILQQQKLAIQAASLQLAQLNKNKNTTQHGLLLSLLQKFPTSQHVHQMFRLQARHFLNADLPEQAQQLLSLYLGQLKSLSQSGIWGWTRNFNPALQPISLIYKEERFFGKLPRHQLLHEQIQKALRKGSLRAALLPLQKTSQQWSTLPTTTQHFYVQGKASIVRSQQHLQHKLIHAQKLLRHATKLSRQDRWREAQPIFQRFLLTLPSSRSHWKHKIKRYQRRASKAQRLLQQAKTLLKHQKWKRAKKLYKRYLAWFPRSSRRNAILQKIKDCECGLEVPWAPCKKNKKR